MNVFAWLCLQRLDAAVGQKFVALEKQLEGKVGGGVVASGHRRYAAVAWPILCLLAAFVILPLRSPFCVCWQFEEFKGPCSTECLRLLADARDQLGHSRLPAAPERAVGGVQGAVRPGGGSSHGTCSPKATPL